MKSRHALAQHIAAGGLIFTRDAITHIQLCTFGGAVNARTVDEYLDERPECRAIKVHMAHASATIADPEEISRFLLLYYGVRSGILQILNADQKARAIRWADHYEPRDPLKEPLGPVCNWQHAEKEPGKER